eukprot:2182402-Amphidinium_carterae.1
MVKVVNCYGDAARNLSFRLQAIASFGRNLENPVPRPSQLGSPAERLAASFSQAAVDKVLLAQGFVALDFRVDDLVVPVLDLPVASEVLSAEASMQAVPESAAKVFQVGEHSCLITPHGMACRDCKRHVTSHQGKWSIGTLKKQPCKPKTKRQAKTQAETPNKRRCQALLNASECPGPS